LHISEATFEALKSIDVAHEFRAKNNLSLKECPQESMPLLSNIIHLVMQQNKTRLSIQPKSDCVKEAIDTIKKL
jgi:glycerophosphoryl diester phosphodiesterase